MLRSVLTITLLLMSLSAAATAGDLYEVIVDSREAATTLTDCRVDAVWRTDRGYLVLADRAGVERLSRDGLSFQFVATDVTRARMALDLRHDHSNRDRYPLLYEDGELRLYRVDPIEASRYGETPGLAPLRTEGMNIVYRESRPLNMGRIQQMMDLDSLIGLIRQDSLFSYSTQLETFYRRVTATSGNYLSRNWIIDKLEEFGYDSIIIDSFVTEIYDWPRKVYNVVAVKPGSEYPLHEIIVGGHRDAVPGSPGADDNGTGTVATMEIARILADVDTRMTFKFILFDGEEQGLHGAYHYANAASKNGDSIVLMLNMDMTAHFTNDSRANIYRRSDDVYGPLWGTLADSLAGIDIAATFRSMSSGSDHYPFYQNGYDAIFVQEYYFSSVYHSPRDSTVYMNFDYFTRMTKACLATAYVVDQTYEVAPMLFIDPELEDPPIIYPGLDTNLAVSIIEYAGEQYVPSSAQLHYAVNGAPYQSVPLTSLGAGLFEGILPGQDCYTAIEYYFSAEGVSCGVICQPDPTRPYLTMAATGYDVSFEDNFQQDLGWTVGGNTELGAWEREEPGAGVLGAPDRDYEGAGYCYLTGSGYGVDVDNGMTALFSPTIASTGGAAVLEYARWYSNSSGTAPYSDIFTVGLSPNGGQNWTMIETVGPVEGADGGWVLRRVWVEDLIPGAFSLQLRFAAEDDDDDSQIEAAVDAVRVVEYFCDPLIITEQLPDWTVGMPYSHQLAAVGGEGNLSFSDLNNELVGSGLTLSSSGLVSGNPLSAELISFTAEVTDSVGQSGARLFEFLINPAPEVATTALADATAGLPYEHQLGSTGGTGEKTWSDLYDDLAGTGFALSLDGLLSGTPIDTGVFVFTARVEDVAGALDDQPLSLYVRIFFICGDIDKSGEGPDISDLVYLVDYMFNDGPPPPVMEAADVNNSGGDIDIADLVHLVDYMFTSGPPLVCP